MFSCVGLIYGINWWRLKFLNDIYMGSCLLLNVVEIRIFLEYSCDIFEF